MRPVPYLVNGGQTINNFTTRNIGEAICDSGDFVINGGFIVNSLQNDITIADFINAPILPPLGTFRYWMASGNSYSNR